MVPGLCEAGTQTTELETRAEADYQRVALAISPGLVEASACEQSEAALVSIAAVDQLPLIHYRKGYCALVVAALGREASPANEPNPWNDAAWEFHRAIEAWPLAHPARHNQAGTPVPAILPLAEALARFHAAGANGVEDKSGIAAAETALAAAEEHLSCGTEFTTTELCEAYADVGREWMGWIALRSEDLALAARDFSSPAAAGWSNWTAGLEAFRNAQYRDAAARYGQAIADWDRDRTEIGWFNRLRPQPDWADSLTEWGGARLLAGDYTGAIAALDRAAAANPENGRAFYLRGLARERSGHLDEALADYNLASRAAFASARELASGEAHLYRGILLYRRKDYARAEAEFASALNFDVAQGLRADATAWRHLAAVAQGGCQSSRELLGRSLTLVSPFFPRQEAQAAAAACSDSGQLNFFHFRASEPWRISLDPSINSLRRL
jgi:tetratricopeptide (TPR) repeat protein